MKLQTSWYPFQAPRKWKQRATLRVHASDETGFAQVPRSGQYWRQSIPAVHDIRAVSTPQTGWEGGIVGSVSGHWHQHFFANTFVYKQPISYPAFVDLFKSDLLSESLWTLEIIRPKDTKLCWKQTKHSFCSCHDLCVTSFAFFLLKDWNGYTYGIMLVETKKIYWWFFFCLFCFLLTYQIGKYLKV